MIHAPRSQSVHHSHHLSVRIATAIMASATLLFHMPDCPATQPSSLALSGRQWEMTEVSVSVAEPPELPVDTNVSATFTNTAGSEFRVSGFWNGNNEYRIRFTPPTAGDWSYTLQSDVSELNGVSGTVAVEAAQEGHRGAVVIDPQHPRRFRYQNGETYFPIAFECDWLFALDAENPNDIPLTRKLVDRLAKDGFNQIVMNVFAFDVNWKKDDRLVASHEYGSPRVFPFAGDNAQPDHSQLNIDYFKRLDRVIEYLDRKGIAAHLMIYVWNKRVAWPEANSEEDNRYFDYVVKRYQAYPNIIWDISKEALGYGHSDVNYITQRIKRLRQHDAHQRLVTVHDYSYCRRFPKQLDFISVQLWQSELFGVMRKVVSDIPGKPILNIEHGGYEAGPYEVFTGNYTSAEVCLERAYQCVFAGTYPTHYWQGAAWNVVIADIDSLPANQQPRLEYYRHLQTLVDHYGLDSFQAGGRHCSSGFSLHDGNDLYVYYVPKENMSMNLRLPKSKRGQTMTIQWFDPFTGTFSDKTQQDIPQWPIVRKPPGERFAILIVDTGQE